MGLSIPITADDLKIQVVMPDQTDNIVLSDAMKINELNLQQEFLQQASWYAYYSALLATQEERIVEMKRKQTRYQADLGMKIRRGEIKLGEVADKTTKITKDSIEDYIELDKKNQVLQDEIEIMQAVAAKLDILVRASVQRKDMLVQLGLIVRQEHKNNAMN